MFVDREHKDYDATMEVALFIPRAPHFASIGLIAEDLGVGSQLYIQSAIRTLKDDEAFSVAKMRSRKMRVPGVRTLNVEKIGRCVQVAPGAWPAFRKRCEAYWSKVYADNSNNRSRPVTPAGVRQ